jgi:hypothetical protein
MQALNRTKMAISWAAKRKGLVWYGVDKPDIAKTSDTLMAVAAAVVTYITMQLFGL